MVSRPSPCKSSMSYCNLEKDLLRDLLGEKNRPDGRSFDQMRNIDMKFGDTYGHVEVRLGITRLIVQVSASVNKPRPERPFEGIFHISTDISSMASPQFENGRTTGTEEILVSRMIEKSIRRSNALDLESLCIVAGKRCWMVRADVHYLDYDGGLVDASCIGVIAALLHYRRPDTSIEGGIVIVHDIADRPPVPLSVLQIPVSVSWSFIALPQNISEEDMEDSDDEADNGMQTVDSLKTIALMDATAAEQDLKIGEITITINKDGELCQITKAGGAQLSTSALLRFTQNAHQIAKQTTKLIHSELEADYRRRNRGNLGSDLAKSREATALNAR